MLDRNSRFLLLVCLFVPFFVPLAVAQEARLPDGFVYVDEVLPGVSVELRYHTEHNFVGTPIDGYRGARCILTREAAEALKGVQEDLKPFGLGLKIYDGYRPQRAVNHFVRWAQDLSDTRMKQEFYPNVDKADLFKEGYIAEKSSHSRGSTVDLTIVPLEAAESGAELDMGGAFDFFGPESWPDWPLLTPSLRAHRMLLQTLMRNHGFQPYPKEWWHFTLRNEPYPNTVFDFPVQ